MSPRRVSPLASIALALAAGSVACAQTFNTPTYFTWGEYPGETRPNGDFNFHDDIVRKVVQPNLQYDLSNPITDQIVYVNKPWAHPESVALWVAKSIKFEITTSHRMSAEKIGLILQNFGTDNYKCDAAQFAQEDLWDTVQGISPPNGTYASLRFYQPGTYPLGDRLPGLNEWEGGPFPRPRNINLASSTAGLKTARSGGVGADYGSARSYRHPFLVNGKTGYQMVNGKKVYDAPLKEWMNRFVDRLTDIYEHPSNYPELDGYQIPNPSTYRYYFDTEPSLAFFSDQNTIFMFKYLCEHNEFWESALLPGFNQTLKDHYNDHRGVFNGPANPATVLNEFALPSHPTNRDVMRYYYELCQNVQDFIMDNCAYSVLRDKFGSEVKCGNYEDYQVDGAPSDRFGWSQRRPWVSNSLSVSNTDSDISPNFFHPNALTDMFPRLSLNKARGGPDYFIGTETNPARYIYTMTTGHGSVGSPSMYRLGKIEMYGLDAGGDDNNDASWTDRNQDPLFSVDTPYDFGHARWNAYRVLTPFPTDPSLKMPVEERPWDAALRIHRHNAEAIINSAGGGSDKLVPWIQMCAVSGAAGGDARLNPQFATADDARELLMMLRAKNIREAILWSEWFNYATDLSYATFLKKAWIQTARVAHQVYATRVHTYQRIHGSAPVGGQTEPSRLEFTLRQPGPGGTPVDQTVDIGNVGGLPGSTGPSYTMLQVDFRWEDNQTLLSGVDIPPSLGQYKDIWINVESAVSADDAEVEVFLYNFVSDSWMPASPRDPGDSFTKLPVTTPASSDGWHRTRLRFGLHGANDYASYKGTVTYPDGSTAFISRVHIKHSSAAHLVSSKQDLVQLALAESVDYTIIQQDEEVPATPASLSIADIDHNGVLDVEDTLQFLDDYDNGEPAADLNFDGQVDANDAEKFLNKLLEE